jgi:alanine racemase
MPITFSEVAKIVKGKVLQAHSPDAVISQLLTDSRNLLFPTETLFFTFSGKRLSGIDFVSTLYHQGVRSFIIDKAIDTELYPEANFILVQTVVDALQCVASYQRKKFDIPVIGITGSNGKTIIKEWLYQLMHEDYFIVRNPKSYNSQIGVPLSVWKMDALHNLGIFEAGISEADEMDKLAAIIRPTIGLISNIGEAHNEGFLNMRQKIREKLKLFKDTEIIIFCADHIDIHQNIGEVQHQTNNFNEVVRFKTLSWGVKHEADIQISYTTEADNKTSVKGIYQKKEYYFVIPFTDRASIENALHCFAMLLYFKYDEKTIQQRMLQLTTVAMRLELKEGINNCFIINDTYNSDINALRIAVDFLNQQAKSNLKTIILSDILQSGRNEIDLYQEVAKILSQHQVRKIYAIGPKIHLNKSSFSNSLFKVEFFKTTEEFIEKFDPQEFRDQTILIKGARKFKFEHISKMLERKAHETVLEINLNALAHNLNIYHSILKPTTKIMVMIKAFGYGSGGFEIAKLLEHQRVDYLAVAYADEGVELRKAGIKTPILVLNPEISNFDLMFKYRLEPEIFSLRILNKYIESSHELGYDETEKILPIHIKLDTGMHRLGFEEKEIDTLLSIIQSQNKIKVNSIFSHLAASDEPEHDAFTMQQIRLFEKMSNKINQTLGYPAWRHILNSNGITRFKEYQYEMVRLGLGVYGIDSSNQIQDLLLPVGALKSTIAQIKHVKKGETIGYGRKGIAQKDSVIATVGIGYADGLNRRLSNGNGYMLVHQQKAPIIGNVCMDMAMIDITDIEQVKEGDEVLIFGKELPIQQLAQQIGTIPYEVLTSISQRVKRIYFQE